MNKKIRVILSLFSLLLSACASGPETRYYMLASQRTVNQQIETMFSSQNEGKNLLLRNVDIPDYLNRLQIVTRTANGSLNIDDDNQWAEPLNVTMRRVLAENLSSLLTPRQIYSSDNQLVNNEADYNWDIQVFNFEKKTDNILYFKALFTLSDKNKGVLLREIAEINTPISISTPPQSYGAMVNAMNSCLANFASKLATSLQTIERGNSRF